MSVFLPGPRKTDRRASGARRSASLADRESVSGGLLLFFVAT